MVCLYLIKHTNLYFHDTTSKAGKINDGSQGHEKDNFLNFASLKNGMRFSSLFLFNMVHF